MKRLLLPGMLLWLVVAATLSGQTREAYQQAYRDWRQNDANLERDAATAGEALGPRTEKAAAGASKFASARKAFYDAQRVELAEQWKTLQPFELPVETEKGINDADLATREASLADSIEVFGGDPDKGIQQLRQALEKERAALTALRSAIKTRETAMNAAKLANGGAEQARNDTAEQIKAISASFEQSAKDAGELVETWPVYYRALASGARGVWVSDATSGAASSALVPAGVQITRYSGSWIFTFGLSTYRGPSPFSFDMFVREANGQVFGTVNARFIVTGNADPDVRFAFSGTFQEGLRQAFPLQTAEGATGTVELIPGTALNMLEVNYSLNGAPGKISQAGVILVKR